MWVGVRRVEGKVSGNLRLLTPVPHSITAHCRAGIVETQNLASLPNYTAYRTTTGKHTRNPLPITAVTPTILHAQIGRGNGCVTNPIFAWPTPVSHATTLRPDSQTRQQISDLQRQAALYRGISLRAPCCSATCRAIARQAAALGTASDTTPCPACRASSPPLMRHAAA